MRRRCYDSKAELFADAAKDNPVLCTLDDKTSVLATQLKTTRSAAAVDLWRPHLDNAVIAIGNSTNSAVQIARTSA